MYKELSSKRQPTFFEILFVITISFMILFFSNYIFLKLNVHTGYTDLVTILFFTFIAFWLIRKYVVSFKYMLISNEFIVQEVIGTKEKVLLNINISQIKKIGLLKTEQYIEDKKKSYKTKNKYFNNWGKAKRYYCIYDENGETFFFEFQPSKKLINLIEEKQQERLMENI